MKNDSGIDQSNCEHTEPAGVTGAVMAAKQEPEYFTVQLGHPACRLEGCRVTPDGAGALSFQFQQPGHHTVVLHANTPLLIVEQHNLTARLRPGWDGTLGYSLYALEVDADAAGVGRVRLEVEPVPAENRQFATDFAGRASRFPDSPAAFRAWQQEWRKKLVAWLMNGELPARVPLADEIMSIEERPSFTLRRVSYKTRPDRTNTLLLSLPKNVSGRVPLLVALHGHEAIWGEADAGAYTAGHADDFCAYFAERGWAVLQPATMNHTLQHADWTLQGEWTWDAMVALDYAAALPEVEARRVAVCGLSTGANLAMNLLALDDRVRTGVVGCILSTWNHYRQRLRIPPHCDCGILSQLGERLEPCDWAALAAPKAVQFQHGRKDTSFCPGADPALLNLLWNTAVMPEAEFAAAFAEVQRAWRLAAGAGPVSLHIHNEEHRVDSAEAFAFLEQQNQ